MNARLVLTLTLACLLAAGLAAACGKDTPEDPVEAYFRRVREVNIEFQERGGELAAQFQQDAAASGSSDVLGLARIFIERSVPVFDEFVAELDAIEPPNDVLGIHLDAVEAARGLADQLHQLNETAKQASSFAELQQSFDEAFSGAAYQRYVDACLTLEDIAISRQLSLNLPCE